MRFHSVMAVCLCVCGGLVRAQTGDPEVTRAQAGIERLRALVEAGAAPRIELERAEDALADAQDEACLRKTLYQGKDLTEAQAEEMVGAAERRYDRRSQALDRIRKLVSQGVASQVSLGKFQDDLDMAKKECDLAEERARMIQELARMAQAELAIATAPAPSGEVTVDHGVAERYDGNGIFTPGIFAQVEAAFENRFGKALPVSAMGETALHRALGFDHRGRVDVAINPDQPEGVWLREYLSANHIPYFAFRQAVPGKATGAHIHLGPMSTRLAVGG